MHVLTFDIEEWFHLLGVSVVSSVGSWHTFESRIHANVDRILTALSPLEIEATFFCLGWIAERYPEVVKKIAANGHELGSHSDVHLPLPQLTASTFAEDLRRSVGVLEDLTGQKVLAFRAPGFSLTKQVPWAIEVLASNGIDVDCSIFPALRAHGGEPTFPFAEPVWLEANGIRIKEFPVSAISLFGQKLVVSGGGYFRMCPYSLIRAAMEESPYVLAYFHPRDFDPDQPVLPGLSLWRKMKSYYGIEAAFGKFQQLIRDYDFCSVSTAVRQVCWDQAPRVCWTQDLRR